MRLEKAKREALELLADVPRDAEVSIAGVEDQLLWWGMGACVGSGLAVYRGAYDFKITDAGRAYLVEQIGMASDEPAV